MKWSFKIGRFAGIDVYLHVTFLLFLGVLAILHWQAEPSVLAVAQGVGFFLSLFLCVVLHEYGHALTARRFGVRTRDITLLPIGGVARLERIPDRRLEEFWVAIAGPAVNLVIAGVLFVVLKLTGSFVPLDEIGLTRGNFLERLMLVNLMLIAFNLLPAFPMDGGRVLRSLLALKFDFARATRIAATLGQLMALIFVVVGFLTGHLMLTVIAFFVWVGAGQEVEVAQVKSAIGGLPVERAMLTEFRVLAPGDPLERAVQLLLAGHQQDFPVVDAAGTVVGILARADLVEALARSGPGTPVEAVMRREFARAELGDSLETVFERSSQAGVAMTPVYSGGRLVGLLTPENVGELVMIRRALGLATPAAGKPPLLRGRSSQPRSR